MTRRRRRSKTYGVSQRRVVPSSSFRTPNYVLAPNQKLVVAIRRANLKIKVDEQIKADKNG